MRKFVLAVFGPSKVKVLPKKEDRHWGKRAETLCKRVIMRIDQGI